MILQLTQTQFCLYIPQNTLLSYFLFIDFEFCCMYVCMPHNILHTLAEIYELHDGKVPPPFNCMYYVPIKLVVK